MKTSYGNSPSTLLHNNNNSSSSQSHHPQINHIRERNNKKSQSQGLHGGGCGAALSAAIPLRFSLRGYGFCMATLFLFCFCSLFYQLNGGPPRILLDIRQYLGKKNFFFVVCFYLPPSVARGRAIPEQ